MYSTIVTGTKKSPYVVSLVADKDSDIATLPTHYSPGSTCFVLESSKTYSLTHDKQWIPIDIGSSGSGGGVDVDVSLATRDDIDKLFANRVVTSSQLASKEDIDKLF